MAVRPIATTGVALASAGLLVAAMPAIAPPLLDRDIQVAAAVEADLAASTSTVENPYGAQNVPDAFGIIENLIGAPVLGDLVGQLDEEQVRILSDAFARGGATEVARTALDLSVLADEDEDEDNGDDPGPAPIDPIQAIGSLFLDLFFTGGMTAVVGVAALVVTEIVSELAFEGSPIPGDLVEIFFMGMTFQNPDSTTTWYRQGLVGVTYYVLDQIVLPTVLAGGLPGLPGLPDFGFPGIPGLPDFGFPGLPSLPGLPSIPGLPFSTASTQLLNAAAVEADEEQGSAAAASDTDPGSSSGIFARVVDRLDLPTAPAAEESAADETDEESADEESADEESADEDLPAEEDDEPAGEELDEDTGDTGDLEDTEDGGDTGDTGDLDGADELKDVAESATQTKPQLNVPRPSQKFTPGGSLPSVGADLNKALDGLDDPADEDATESAGESAGGTTAGGGSLAADDNDDAGDDSDDAGSDE